MLVTPIYGNGHSQLAKVVEKKFNPKWDDRYPTTGNPAGYQLLHSDAQGEVLDTLLTHLDVSFMKKAAASTGRKGFSKEALLCAFDIMKCEGFSQITDLVDYLSNNFIMAHYCGIKMRYKEA